MGWSLPTRKVCDAIKQKIPESFINCKPEEVFTSILEIHLLIGEKESKERRFVYKGDKETVLGNVEMISEKVEEAYRKV